MNLPIFRPQLPKSHDIVPYIKRIDKQRYYSNFGPLCLDFEARLAEHFGVNSDEVVTSANATLGLVQVLKALSIKPGTLCVLPSWTFVATASAVVYAGLVPFFIDVDLHDWMIHPEKVLPLLSSHDVGAIIVVSAFGAQVDSSAWYEFQKKFSIPVIIDAAAGFDSFSRLNQNSPILIPYVVSLHATKVFGIGEGAVTVTGDPELAEKIRRYGNFGFFGSRKAEVQGINAKLSEYAAAVGLASLDAWLDTRAAWLSLREEFGFRLKKIQKVTSFPDFDNNWISSYCLISIKDRKADMIGQTFKAKGVETRKWWGDGCHAEVAYRNYQNSGLDNTVSIASEALGIPYWLGMSQKDINRIFQIIEMDLM